MKGFYHCLSVVVILGTICRASAADEPALKLSEEERVILEWTNREREKKKLPALQPNPLLFAAARSHSANMARQKKMSHELDGKNPAQRVLEAGYDYAEVGENLAAGDGPVPEFFTLWLKSPPHRANLLGELYREIGIGLARDDKGQIYCTVVFGTPRQKR